MDIKTNFLNEDIEEIYTRFYKKTFESKNSKELV